MNHKDYMDRLRDGVAGLVEVYPANKLPAAVTADMYHLTQRIFEERDAAILQRDELLKRIEQELIPTMYKPRVVDDKAVLYRDCGRPECECGGND